MDLGIQSTYSTNREDIGLVGMSHSIIHFSSFPSGVSPQLYRWLIWLPSLFLHVHVIASDQTPYTCSEAMIKDTNLVAIILC